MRCCVSKFRRNIEVKYLSSFIIEPEREVHSYQIRQIRLFPQFDRAMKALDTFLHLNEESVIELGSTSSAEIEKRDVVMKHPSVFQ